MVGQSGSKNNDPDKGNPMNEGEMRFNKGYEEQHGNESPYFPKRGQRGNDYTALQNKIKSRDTSKISRGMFTKIA